MSAITDWSDASSVTMFAMLLKMLELISGVMLFGDDGVKRAAIVAYVVENGEVCVGVGVLLMFVSLVFVRSLV